MEFDPDFAAPVFWRCRSGKRYHLFWDDIDKFKMTDLKSQGLFDLIDTIYRNGLSLTLTSNFTLKELVDLEKLHPALGGPHALLLLAKTLSQGSSIVTQEVVGRRDEAETPSATQ